MESSSGKPNHAYKKCARDRNCDRTANGRNFAEAAEWMIKAHKAGDRDALKIAAEYRMMAINRQKAEAGDPDAQAAFARALVRHSPDLRQAGADRDLREAVHWYGESYKQTRDPKTAAKLQLLKC